MSDGTQGSQPDAEVVLAEDLDGLLVIPRPAADPHAVLEGLRRALPSAALRRTAHGIEVSAAHAPMLLTAATSSLRFTTEAQRFAENRRWARTVHAWARERVRAIAEGGRAVAERHLVGVKDLDRLDDHQVVDVAAMTLPDSPGLCVFDEQGAGKTVTTVFAFDVLVGRDWSDAALIVAPKSMVAEWAAEIIRFKGDLYRVSLVTGGRAGKLGALRGDADVYVTNFETAVGLEPELRAVLRRRDSRCLLVVDESFFVKNLDAKRTRALRRLREWCGRAFVLCGTPAPNAAHDLVQQFNLVDFGVTFEGVVLPDDPAQAAPAVQARITERGLYLRHLKRDVLPGLPGKTFHQVLVRLQPEQERAYRAALNDLILDLRATDEQTFQRQIGSFLARRSALLQICSSPGAVVPGYAETPGKLLALDEILADLVERRGEKVVLWSYYTHSLDALAARYARLRPVRYDGSVVLVEARRDAVRRFQEDGETMLFIGNPAAAGAGLTLHRARFAVYESLSNQAAHYLQSLDRIHRRGQARDVEYLVLLCDRTLELAEYERLLQKERAAQALLGDRDEPRVTRELMLDDMLAAWRFLDSGGAGAPETRVHDGRPR